MEGKKGWREGRKDEEMEGGRDEGMGGMKGWREG